MEHGLRGRKAGATLALRYDADIMMARTQITLDPETQRRARQRASDMVISLAEYVRRLVARDLAGLRPSSNPAMIFDLGASAGFDIANHKDVMIAEAFASNRRRPRRRSA